MEKGKLEDNCGRELKQIQKGVKVTTLRGRKGDCSHLAKGTSTPDESRDQEKYFKGGKPEAIKGSGLGTSTLIKCKSGKAEKFIQLQDFKQIWHDGMILYTFKSH